MFYDAFSQDIFLGHLPWNCVFCPGPPIRYRARRDSNSGALAGAPRSQSAGLQRFRRVSYFLAADPKLRTPYTRNFNLNIQQQLGSKAVFQFGYAGSKGTKLFQFLDINQPSQQQISGG